MRVQFGTKIEESLQRKLVIVAAQDRLKIQDIVNEALELWLSQRNGKKGGKR